MNESIFYSLYDPYVYQTLQSVTGSQLVVETTKGTLRGTLTTVMPDHIVVEIDGTPFFIRTQQIVWVSPS
ncbi:hypothetical protein N781_00775 [Pontibacillus halophilus JSM 076056 = DSM 19796]|uniref:DUF2642 domain-containing protein n=1 Tax=Pontibacillus halophilus JSM 076056 = DSM 19796 TaxID=1385510 RepID=A0A0A5ID49_9BACI|nr:YuzF family protein [Pontibacillus halophilus]KGX93767.1 hypothetical protein N781_00775 [Pontibacillus halophilus JSM 076056 = DSM 19796]